MTPAVAITEPRCQRCQSGDHLILDDGPAICRPCIDLLGAVAGDPHRADNRILTALVERHGDVVSLVRVPTTPGETELRWRWTESWPR